MRIRYMVLARTIIALTALIVAGLYSNIFSGPGTYVVTPAVPPEATGATPVDAAGVSWWSLPLWIQIASILDALLIVFGLIKCLPFIAGRIENVLDNRNRFQIFTYVQKNPGCTPAEITARQHMKNGTVKYHIQMLESEGMIVLRRMGKFTRLFRNVMSSDMERAAATYLRNETSRNILRAIMDNPGITNRSLSEQFQLDKSSIHWHMERFLKDNMVRFEQDGKYKRYFVSEEAKGVLSKSMSAAATVAC